ncbi:polysaccharide biosynthesis tyrosine autokinase [Castellaniella caeni]|uniref:polysaccharide biosynthesis tyrosine autokinase n=1 Tax=Castellaniella caeni TaxID=266123 RepID=UPI0008301367|nr:polysaccharide biosynthesis tyrosine autokinase [Castellaniella caeni]
MKVSPEFLPDGAGAAHPLPASHLNAVLAADPRLARAAPERIGDLFVRTRRLSPAEVAHIAQVQEAKNLRFGDAAVSLGLLSEQEVWQALSRQYQYPTAPLDGRFTTYPVVGAPYSQEAEAVRKLRTQILLGLDMRHLQSLVVAGPHGGEGKTYLAESLAFAFAQNGQRTLLINADLRARQQSGLFDSQRQQGLSLVLSGRQPLQQSLVDTPFLDLKVLDAGPLPPNPAELFSAPALDQVFNELRGQFDLVLIDTPAVSRFPDVQLIAQQASACLIVARQHRTSLSDIQRAKRLVQVAGGRLLGSVYNVFPR